MTTILIATDFSSAARNATLYGFELSKAMNAKVILFNVYQLPTTHLDSMVYLPADDMERVSYSQLVEEAELLDPKRTVALQTQTDLGPVGDAILNAALENNASFIVIGMKGRGKEVRKYFGSTVTILSKQSQIPLIVVPEEATFVDPQKIALASDINNETDISTLQPLKQIAVRFNSNVFVVRVVKKNMDEAAEKLSRSERLDWYLTSLKHSFEYLKGENIAKTVHLFVKEQNVDMVAVMPHEHSFMERLFTRSVTKDLIFHTHVPLLILPSEPKKATTSEEVDTTHAAFA